MTNDVLIGLHEVAFLSMNLILRPIGPLTTFV